MVQIAKLSPFWSICFLLLVVPIHAKWFWESKPVPETKRSWTALRKLIFRERVRGLWTHAFDNYMLHAFPMDELRPLSCVGRGPAYDDPNDWVVNDVAGNFSVTLIDVLDTFVVMNDRRGFAQAVQNVINVVPSFDLDTRPQVFETNIRVLGGLLSAHQFASNPKHKFHLKWYKGELLRLAYDLGSRLLPAFNTPTGIPYARVNLRHGVLLEESPETCTAGAGTLILEFGVLSRLTGDPRFEKAAYKAFFALWNRKSDIGLVGNTINCRTGFWTSDATGIGAGIDSFYEYAFKWYILSGETEFLDVWNEAYSNIMRYSRGQEGYWFRQVNMKTGEVIYSSTDSLSSFWAGLQVLAGDVQNAIKSHLFYWNLWRRFAGIPEVFDLNTRLPSAWQYPLRPEFIESTYFLYRATHDTLYLDIGEKVLDDLESRSKVDCGLASIASLLTNKRDDRMESFVLSETLKYLYLLFDDDNPIHTDDSNMVFSTEGHLLTLLPQHLQAPPPSRRKLRKGEKLQCPAYSPLRFPWSPKDQSYGLATGIRSREDAEFARVTVGLADGSWAAEDDSAYWFPGGWCDVPKVDLYSLDFILSSTGEATTEDLSPDRTKLYMVDGGYVIINMTGIRAHITTRLDGTGYDITRLGPFRVKTGQKVYLNDTSFHVEPITPVIKEIEREIDITLRFSLQVGDASSLLGVAVDTFEREIMIVGHTALFGGDPTIGGKENDTSNVIPFGGPNPLLLVQPIPENIYGCLPYSQAIQPGSVLFVQRGDCTFIQKLRMAKAAGAAGVIVASDSEDPINPTADPGEKKIAQENLSDVALVVVTRSVAQMIYQLLEIASSAPGVQLHTVVVHQENPPNQSRPTSSDRVPSGARHLYVNGKPLINVELLV
ncbi:glycoside hydrolase family 47 protein [Sphaerobolus stellatus SS14]|nr:glycoside hydrolase family 47 protein [Sphaerobolus stellatus SS14]